MTTAVNATLMVHYMTDENAEPLSIHKIVDKLRDGDFKLLGVIDNPLMRDANVYLEIEIDGEYSKNF